MSTGTISTRCNDRRVLVWIERQSLQLGALSRAPISLSQRRTMKDFILKKVLLAYQPAECGFLLLRV